MAQFQHLSPQDAKTMLGDENTVIVDIRDLQSYQQSHITGAKALNNDNVQEFIASTGADQPIIVCCYHGNSSQQAAAFLTEQGFASVYSLEGGFEYWRQFAPELCES